MTYSSLLGSRDPHYVPVQGPSTYGVNLPGWNGYQTPLYGSATAGGAAPGTSAIPTAVQPKPASLGFIGRNEGGSGGSGPGVDAKDGQFSNGFSSVTGNMGYSDSKLGGLLGMAGGSVGGFAGGLVNSAIDAYSGATGGTLSVPGTTMGYTNTLPGSVAGALISGIMGVVPGGLFGNVMANGAAQAIANTMNNGGIGFDGPGSADFSFDGNTFSGTLPDSLREAQRKRPPGYNKFIRELQERIKNNAANNTGGSAASPGGSIGGNVDGPNPSGQSGMSSGYGDKTKSNDNGGGKGGSAKDSKGSGCFAPGTMVEMADGTEKDIAALRVGDMTRGGEVTRTMTVYGSPLWEYRGVQVAGDHYVILDGEAVMVEDAPGARKVEDIKILHTLNTSDRRIWIGGVEFADHDESRAVEAFAQNTDLMAGIDPALIEREIASLVVRRIL